MTEELIAALKQQACRWKGTAAFSYLNKQEIKELDDAADRLTALAAELATVREERDRLLVTLADIAGPHMTADQFDDRDAAYHWFDAKVPKEDIAAARARLHGDAAK
jgi:hypothetical protein